MNLQSIFDLAARFPIFPVQWADNGACSCGDLKCQNIGKHPLTRDGVKSATHDPDRLRAWHERWPKANWGIACGGASRILVIDIDPDKGGEASWRRLTDEHGWPDCPTVRTGSGGYHYYMRVPDGVDMPRNSASGLAPGVDIRSEGGYVVAPGSMHRSGNAYEWAEFEDEPIPDAPVWLIAKLASLVSERKNNPQPKTPEGKIREGRHDWILAITAAFRSGAVPRAHVVHFVRALIPTTLDLSDGREITDKEILDAFDGVVAKHGEALPEDIVMGERVARALISELDRDALPATAPNSSTLPAKAFTGLRGPLRALFDYAMHAPRPQPELAMAAALTTFAAVLGGRVETRTGLRTNFYMVGICDSGGGKDEPRKACKRALRAAGMDEWIGSDYWASSTAIHSLLQNFPTRISYVDEFGKVVAAINNPKAGTHLEEIVRVLLMIYSAAGDTYDATAYADAKKNVRIEEPHLCIFGTTTYGPLFASLKRESISDGLLARCLFTAASDNLPFYNHDYVPTPPPAGLVEALKIWRRYGNELGGPMRVYETEEAALALADYREICDDRKRKSADATDVFWTRSGGHVAKLALIHACGGHNPADADPPVICLDSVQWAIQYVDAATWWLIRACQDSIAETGHERTLVELEAHIGAYGTQGISRTELRKTFRKITGKQLFDAVDELHEQERVAFKDIATGGRSAVHIYRCRSV